MSNAKELAFKLREVILTGHWVANTNFKKILSDTRWNEAEHRLQDLHTIAELVFHVDYYFGGVLEVLRGGELTIRDQYSFDLPELKNDDDWNSLRARLLANAEELANLIEELTEEQLKEPFVKEAYGTYQRNIDGLIEHAYYHLGQLSLIKKMISKQGH